jgi:N-acetylglucosaminyl-diphospho-decaprenol L-rhamnosyltransferase
MVDIVIVNWNSGEYLKMCLTSIYKKENDHLVNKIIVVDNNSADLFPADIPNNSRLILIQNKKNEGFSKACNQGFQKCTADFVLLLNPDAMLLPKTLSDSIHFMNQYNDIDILGCCLLDDKGIRTKSCCRFPSPVRIFFDAAGLSKIAPKIFKPASIMTDWDHLQSSLVDMVIGAFMFMRKKVFEKNGYFDERFFVYYEEVDFSKRLQFKVKYFTTLLSLRCIRVRELPGQ